ncbi:MAG: B12-binding domain-containing radical SAM protein [Gammaproteobacteria bacterium]|nr:B12-binding domain-containing radical SAM protein [Gammaproteobacteria bacterium]
MLKIALLSPKGPLYRHRGGIFRKSLRYSPLTLPTLAALVPDDIEHELSLFDEGIEDIPDVLDADLVGITVITGTANRAYEISRRLRQQGITVVMGGPHVTLVPEDAAPHADAVVTGYAEDSWPRLIRDFAAGQLQNRYVQAPDLSLAGRPFARRDLVSRNRYSHTHVFEASRGCVHRCDFCVVPSAWGRTPYQKPVHEVIDEIRSTGARRAIFIDLNLVADPDYAAELFEALVPLDIQWAGLATSLLARNAALLELCARSGCIGLLVGFESISQSGLKTVHKGFNTPAEYREWMQRFHEHGIAINGTFVFGLDTDTRDSFEETAQFVIDAAIDLPRFAVLTPFPGTPLFERLDREGRILTRNWELYDGQHVVFKPLQMSVNELEKGHHGVWNKVYSYSSIARRMMQTPITKSLYLAANFGYRYYARRLDRFYTCDWRLVPGDPVCD